MKLRSSPVLDAFAERLSIHGNVLLAGHEIGRGKASARKLFLRLRERLGKEQTR